MKEKKTAYYRKVARVDAIDLHNGELFVRNISKHNIEGDTIFLISHIPYLSIKSLLDVGYGTGTLLLKIKELNRNIKAIGVDKSRYLFNNTHEVMTASGISVYCEDFIYWSSFERFDIIIMSFFLHHIEAFQLYLQRAFSMLKPNGRVIIMDRIAVNERAKNEFTVYWTEEYKDAHEWDEDCPNILSKEDLITVAHANGYFDVNFYKVPNDNRKGTQMFPKTLAILRKNNTGYCL